MSPFRNIDSALRFCNAIFTVFGVWPPPGLNDLRSRLYTWYSFLLPFLTVGVYIIIQTGDLVQVWGDITLMTASVFILFSNIAQVIKLAYIIPRRDLIRKIIFDGNCELDGQNTKFAIQTVKRYRKNSLRLVMVYYSAAFSSIFGVTISAEKNQLPLRAWYPFDATKRPVYQWTYAHQIIALSIAAGVNLCCDVLASALIGQCRCRMRLIADSLRTLCDDVEVDKKGRVTAEGEKVLKNRVRSIAMRHQLVLEQVKQLQQCFSIPILVQFAVAAFIICVTAYRMAFENSFYRLMSMIIYIIVITMQVYIYCVEGNNLTIDSYEISRAAYECPWYECSVPLRRLLLVIMIRCTRPTIITAGGIVELSLDTFVSIMKASYTFFTVLQSTGDL